MSPAAWRYRWPINGAMTSWQLSDTDPRVDKYPVDRCYPGCEVEALVPEHKLQEALEALNVIARASERSETMFGGKMSDVTRVFQNISRVARQALQSVGGGE